MRAERSIISYSTEIHRRDQGYKYILGCMEKNIDNYWSDAWTGSTRLTILDEKPPVGFAWSGRRLTRKQTTSRPDRLWPEIWNDMSHASKRKEKPKWAIEKPKLDTARKLRGIYLIDLDDEEFKEIRKNARRKLEVPVPAAMLCETPREECRETCNGTENCKTKDACIVEADESTRKCLEGTLHKNDEDHITGKGINSLSHYNLVRKFIPMPQAMKIPDAKAAVDKRMKKPEKIPTWQLRKVRNKYEVIAEARNEGKTVLFCVVNGPLSSKDFGVGAAISKVQKAELYSEVTL